MDELRLQVPNDVFQYFYRGEEPLDEESWEEIEELKEEFPLGCKVLDDWQYLQDEPGMVEATFASQYTEEEEEPEECNPNAQLEAWDMYMELFNEWRVVLRWVEPGLVACVAFWHPRKGVDREQEVRILCNGKNDYFITASRSYFFLKHFKPCV